MTTEACHAYRDTGRLNIFKSWLEPVKLVKTERKRHGSSNKIEIIICVDQCAWLCGTSRNTEGIFIGHRFNYILYGKIQLYPISIKLYNSLLILSIKNLKGQLSISTREDIE